MPKPSVFPPVPTRPDDIELMLHVFASVIEGRSATYVSSPFTTGRLAGEWLADNRISEPETALVSEDFQAAVLAQNKMRAASFVRSLRRRENAPVIAPTALPDVEGWTQSDYRYFWGRVIEDYAVRVVFLEGWEHSSGCAYEYLIAVRSDSQTLDQELEPIPLGSGHADIAAAAKQIAPAASAAFLAAVANALDDLLPQARRGA